MAQASSTLYVYVLFKFVVVCGERVLRGDCEYILGAGSGIIAFNRLTCEVLMLLTQRLCLKDRVGRLFFDFDD